MPCLKYFLKYTMYLLIYIYKKMVYFQVQNFEMYSWNQKRISPFVGLDLPEKTGLYKYT